MPSTPNQLVNHPVRLASRPVGIGEVMRAGDIGRVIASKNPPFQPGDGVSGPLGVQEYCPAAVWKGST